MSASKSTPVSKLLGAPGDPPMCKGISPEFYVHWFRQGAQPGDACLCGETTMREAG